jgi:predicted DNA-binding protein
MTLMIELPAELDGKLRNEAQLHGMDAQEYAKRLIEAGLSTDIEVQKKLNQRTLDLFAQWAARDATENEEEIAKRDRQVEDFKEAMNQNRRDSDGPDARIPYP